MSFKKFIEIQFIYNNINHLKMYNSAIFSVLTKLYNCYYYLIPEHFHHPQEKPHTCSPLHSLASIPGNHQSTSCVYGFAYCGHFI